MGHKVPMGRRCLETLDPQVSQPGLCFGYIAVLTTVPEYLSVPLRSPRNAVLAVATAAAIGGVAWYLFHRPRPTAEELERARRDLLATQGRITDGSITETPAGDETDETPRLILYNYRIAGVEYEAAQDVTMLSELVKDLRTDLPIQVRYEPHNPANSIVVAERWSGLRLGPHHHHSESNSSATHNR